MCYACSPPSLSSFAPPSIPHLLHSECCWQRLYRTKAWHGTNRRPSHTARDLHSNTSGDEPRSSLWGGGVSEPHGSQQTVGRRCKEMQFKADNYSFNIILIMLFIAKMWGIYFPLFVRKDSLSDLLKLKRNKIHFNIYILYSWASLFCHHILGVTLSISPGEGVLLAGRGVVRRTWITRSLGAPSLNCCRGNFGRRAAMCVKSTCRALLLV